MKNAISPSREEDFSQWYQEVIKAAQLADASPVRGCMVIKPWGYAIWERMQRLLDDRFKELGHENMYFPLFIPKSYLEKEAKHIDGFATECAVVTHHRLVKGEGGELEPDGELEEPLVVRPTSETVIGEMFSRWVQSYRDLPLLMNQWANVVRWEMRTRMFLRTSEFLWQEGHTVHATAEEAQEESQCMLDVYRSFAHTMLAMPVIAGEKTQGERFPGAVDTLCIEAMMQDRKALQAGTSHFLGQNFSKAFDISFLGKDGKQHLAWTTSWGVSTRLIGGLVMTHGDDDGLMLPPAVAPYQVVIMPLAHKNTDKEAVMAYCNELASQLRDQQFMGERIRVYIDKKDERPGQKAWAWVKKGVPIRIEIGQRECDDANVCVGRRDRGYKEREVMQKSDFISSVEDQLNQVQTHLWDRAVAYQEAATAEVSTRDEFYEYFKKNNSGFVRAYWHETPEVEKTLKDDLQVTPRCIPHETSSQTGTCIFTGKEGRLTVFAKAY